MAAIQVDGQRLRQFVGLLVELPDGKQQLGALRVDPSIRGVLAERGWHGGQHLFERDFGVQQLATTIDGVELLDLLAVF